MIYFLVVVTKYLLSNLWVEDLVWAVLEDRVDHSRQTWWQEQVAGHTVPQSGSRESWVLVLSSLSPSVQPGALDVEWHQPNPGWVFPPQSIFPGSTLTGTPGSFLLALGQADSQGYHHIGGCTGKSPFGS